MKMWKTVLPISLLLLLSACGPEDSLSPLFEQKDVVFEDALVGAWVGVEGEKEGEKGETYTFKFKKLRNNAYELTFPLDEGKECKSEVYLVHLGKFLFLDASPADLTKEEEALNKGPMPFPLAGPHIFGRIWIEKDLVRIALLDDKWVTNMVKEKKLTVGYASIDDEDKDTVLTASTEELQKFALQYAEDPEAFSFEVGLCRQGKLEGSDCSIALLKQKLGINPNDAKAWDSLGQTYSEMGRDEEALAAFRRVAQIHPDQPGYRGRIGPDFVKVFPYHLNIGAVLVKLSRYDQARKELQEAAMEPFPEDALYEIAFSYFVEGRFPEAVSAFEKPPRRAYMVDTIIHNLALRHVGKEAEAKKLLQEDAWPIAETQWELLRLAYLQGLITEERLISFPSAFRKFGRSGQVREAETAEQKSEAYFFVGYEYLLKGDKQKAREYFQKVLDTKVVDSEEYTVVRARLAQLGTK